MALVNFSLYKTLIRVPKESSNSWGPNYGPMVPNPLPGRMPISWPLSLCLPFIIKWCVAWGILILVINCIYFCFSGLSHRASNCARDSRHVFVKCLAFWPHHWTILPAYILNKCLTRCVLCVCIFRDNPVKSVGILIFILFISCVSWNLHPLKVLQLPGLHPKGQVFNVWASMGTLFLQAVVVFKNLDKAIGTQYS